MVFKKGRKNPPRRHWYSRRRHSSAKDKRLPLLPMVGLGYNFIRPTPSGRTILDDVKNGNLDNVLYDAKEIFTGIDANGVFHTDWLMQTYIPVLAGFIGSKLMTAVGVNKTLKRVPLIGKYIKL